MTGKEKQRREAALASIDERRKSIERDEEIERKRSTAREKAPPIDGIQGPPWNAAVLAYLEALDRRLERIEDELGIES